MRWTKQIKSTRGTWTKDLRKSSFKWTRMKNKN